MSDTVTLYTNPMSRGQIARWMLEEAGIAYEQRLIGYGAEMKGDGYRAINPMGKVPALQHGDKVVTECAAICAYVADAFPAAGLAPALTDRAGYYRWLFFTAGPVEQAITNNFMGVKPTDEQGVMLGYGNFDLTMQTLADAVSRAEYICAGRFTAADVYVGSQVIWGLQFGSIPARPEFEAYAARLTAREAYVRAKAIDNALIEQAKATQG